MPHRRRPLAWFSLPRRGRAAAAVAGILGAAAFLSVGMAPASGPCTIEWDGGAGTNRFGDAQNWTGDRVPGAADRACIGTGHPVTFGSGFGSVGAIDSESSFTVSGGQLTIGGVGGSSIRASLTVTSGILTLSDDMFASQVQQSGGFVVGGGRLSTPDLEWNGGMQAGSGTTEITSGGVGLAMFGGGRTLAGSRVLHIDSGVSADWTSGDFEMADDARLDNEGRVDIHGDQDFIGCCGQATVVNESGGVIRKSSGDGETMLSYKLANDGELDVRSGTFTLQAGGIPGHDSSGAFRVADGTTMRFVGSIRVTQSGILDGSGRLLFTGGTADLAGAIGAALVVDGFGAIVHVDSDTAPSRIELDRGFLGGAGRVRTGDFAWRGGSLVGSGITELVPGGDGLQIDGDDGHGLFDRTHSIDADPVAAWSGGSISMSGPARLENAGLFDIQGDLHFDGCCDAEALVHNADGGIFRKSLGGSRAEVVFPFQNDGTVDAAVGTLAFQSGVGNVHSGSLVGGTWLVRATLELTGADIVRNSARVLLDGPDSRIEDTTGRRHLAFNDADGDLTVINGRELELPAGGGDFANTGSVSVGQDSAVRASSRYEQGAGTTILTEPTSRLAAGADVAIDGGTLRGVGTVESDLTNAGEVAPGQSPGILAVTGDYTQFASGTLAMEVAGRDPGSEYDRLDVGGTATLAGTLSLATLGGFGAEPDDEFEAIRHSDVPGELDRVDGLQPDAGHYYWPPEYDTSATVLRRGTTPDVSVGDATVTEGGGDGEAVVEVSVDPTPKRTVRLHWDTADGTATSPDDYAASGGIVTIPHGVRTARISVPIHGDAQHEPDESFYVGIGDPSNARIATYQGQVTILDDDPAPPPEEHHNPPPPAHEPPPTPT